MVNRNHFQMNKKFKSKAILFEILNMKIRIRNWRENRKMFDHILDEAGKICTTT